MQLHKNKKKWVTKKVDVKSQGLSLFPAEAYDYSVRARMLHTGYLHLITIYYNKKTIIMDDFEYLTINPKTKEIGHGTVTASNIREACALINVPEDVNVFSISVKPFKLIEDASSTVK